MGMYGDRDVTIGGYMGSQGLPYGDIWGLGDPIGGYMGSQMSPYGDIWGHRCYPMGDIWGHRCHPIGDIWGQGDPIGGSLG